jgi:uncharacterized membrane protein
VNRSAADCYDFWHNVDNFPKFMWDIESVEAISESLTRWVAKSISGKYIQWDSRLIHDVANQVIAWESLPDSPIYHAGSINFREAPFGRGTEVHFTMDYRMHGGKLGRAAAYLFHAAPEQRIADDLRRFKALMEVGEIATIAGQPSCRVLEI